MAGCGEYWNAVSLTGYGLFDVRNERNERKVRINRNSILNELGNENDNNFFMDLAYFNIL